MYNYQIILEYDGSNYVGWQIQKNGTSIQQSVERALSKVLKQKIKINGSGRTDAGVHASGQSANFICKFKIENKLKFLRSVNFFLNKKKISILKIKDKNLNFHARYDVKKKVYKYLILNREARSPLYEKKSWQLKKKLNLINMKKGIKFFLGTHNFSSMRASTCSAKSPVRTITNAFLQKQVRSMVGCLKYVGENKWKPNKIRCVINSGKRNLCAPPAPADGLYLEKVFY